MDIEQNSLINWTVFANERSALGGDFARILGYFREDGTKSVAAIEAAVRAGEAAKIVMPANTLSDEAGQFGAERLSDLAEEIEVAARHFVEIRQQPDELVKLVVELRNVFDESLDALEKETNPLVQRQVSERPPAFSANNGFGRL